MKAMHPNEVRIQEIRDRRENERLVRERGNELAGAVARHLQAFDDYLAAPPGDTKRRTAACKAYRDLTRALGDYYLTK